MAENPVWFDQYGGLGIWEGVISEPEWDDDESADTCPKCDSGNIRCTGSDSVVNIGTPGDGLEHVSWWLCDDCGNRWVGN